MTHPLPVTRLGFLKAVVGFWVAAGLLTGLLHVMELLAARLLLGHLVWFSREFVWMSPVAYTLVMAPGAIVLATAAAISRHRYALVLSAAAFVTAGAFGLLLPYSQVSRLSSLVFSLGAGVAVARAVHARTGQWIRVSARVALSLAAAIVAIAPLQQFLRSAREARAVASLVPAVQSAPNVLIVILDTVRAASLSLYGLGEETSPLLDRWSRDGAVFQWAFSPAPWTLPSHGSMFTGAWASAQSGDWEVPLDNALPTLAGHFRSRGYLTSGFVGNMHYTAWDSGLPRGFDHYEDYDRGWDQLVLSSSYTQTAMFEQLADASSPADVLSALRNPDLSISPKHRFAPRRGTAIVDAFMKWRTGAGERPFFAFLNLFDAHQPYFAPPSFDSFTGPRDLARYHAAIAYLDSELDRLFRWLRERGELDRTLVVVTSDHGELFRFKGLSGHAHNLYVNTIRVPLVFRFPPAVPQGTRIQQAVSLRDLAATVADLATGASAPFPGTSLAATWRQGPRTSPAVSEVSRAQNIDTAYPTARGSMATLLDDRWQLIVNGDGRLELFEYRVDSLQERDQGTEPAAAGVRDSLRRRLAGSVQPRR